MGVLVILVEDVLHNKGVKGKWSIYIVVKHLVFASVLGVVYLKTLRHSDLAEYPRNGVGFTETLLDSKGGGRVWIYLRRGKYLMG